MFRDKTIPLPGICEDSSNKKKAPVSGGNLPGLKLAG